MFGGDAASTLAIDRKEPIYDPLRSAIETVEATALADVGSLKPVRLDVDENGDVVAEKNMPVVLPPDIRILADDEKTTMVDGPLSGFLLKRMADIADEGTLTVSLAAEFRRLYRAFRDMKNHGDGASAFTAFPTGDTKNIDNSTMQWGSHSLPTKICHWMRG